MHLLIATHSMSFATKSVQQKILLSGTQIFGETPSSYCLFLRKSVSQTFADRVAGARYASRWVPSALGLLRTVARKSSIGVFTFVQGGLDILKI